MAPISCDGYYGWKRLVLILDVLTLVVFKVSPSSTQHPIPPLPGVRVTDSFNTIHFSKGYSNLWGAQHQHVSQDQSSVTLRLDRSSGSGFRSKKTYMYGFFSAAIKLPAGYTAGIITSFYLSNNQVYEGWHDEVDIEFLGTVPGEPYKVQTNVYGNGTGDGTKLIGREQHFHLWFDPTLDFHNYSLLWTPHQILFLVDSIPIRRFPKVKSLGVKYPSKPMSVYATIWDASAWATDGGKYKANYNYEPFLSTYTNFIISGCSPRHDLIDKKCSHGRLDSIISPKLNKDQIRALQFVRKNYMVYDYCRDFQRYPKGMPECPPTSKKSSDNSILP
eukprot:Gb_22359 [translate_table: standard]